MYYFVLIILVLNILFCIPSIASITRFDYWWVRGFDFPRIQISILITLNIILGLFVYPFDSTWQYVIIGVLFLSLIYQVKMIYPYTLLAKKQVIDYEGGSDEDHISILVSNVLMNNTDYYKLIALTRKRDPDVLLTLESNKEWEDALSVIEDKFGHFVKIPLENLYGIHLYSKLPLENMSVKYLVVDDIPSIHGKFKLPNGKMASFHCLHPRPPSPTESKTSTNRDAELLLVGKELNKDDELVLVFGDLNDVAWSRTTKLFQKMSGLMDPRRGRGFFNTYNADYKLLRWPLDHVFHSDDFTLMEIAREVNIGSDHFPMYIKLNYNPNAKSEQERLAVDDESEAWAEEKIEKGNPKDKNIKP